MQLLHRSTTRRTLIWLKKIFCQLDTDVYNFMARFLLKDDDWIRHVLAIHNPHGVRPLPSVVGADIKRVLEGRANGAYLALMVHDWSGKCCATAEKLFLSLRDYVYDNVTSEVFFIETGITLHIGDVVQAGQWVTMQDPSRLFQVHDGHFITRILYCGDDSLYELGPESIRTIGANMLAQPQAATAVCSVRVFARHGKSVERVFIRPGECRRVIHEGAPGWRIVA
ncbi:uncharacterized protein FRV6_15337 [Fusarium oxysporum]|uniref:Uncharacterized protein n=1 Tax=Fusarium oxysporum TaxID=5507 RepID=A0A2H3UBA5_FUSOX|nr:uncharacterized protein FRV6_15337 [Fusarium oxysporum]